MKIRITKVDCRECEESFTLADCGFKVGDVVEVDGKFADGSYCLLAIRNTEEIEIGDNVSVEHYECEVVEE
ncbi:hypothetical protein VC1_60 [Vibrio phage Vc1]|uniref:Uncharacterized protein n=1 Tax=Vibrio phage Vc1 TaxID=1480731 RepID=A0A9X9SEH9_9CAUD|nr:hypothetical protein KMB90_gp60 [Vibrio virus 2019VC1]